MNNEIPNWVLNKRKYNKAKYKEIGYKGFTVNVPLETFEEFDKCLKSKGLTREQFIKRIIEKYK